MDEKEKEIRERGEAQCLSNGFMQYNHISLAAVEKDFAAVELTVVPESCNPYGMPHGGAYYTMADTAAGTAARTDGRRYVTQNSNMQFISTVKEGTIRAEATIIHRGRTTCVVRSEVRSSDGKLLVTGDFTFFCLNP